MKHKNFTSVIVRRISLTIAVAIVGGLFWLQRSEADWVFLVASALAVVDGILVLVTLLESVEFHNWKKLNRGLETLNKRVRYNTLLHWDEDKLNFYFSWASSNDLQELLEDFQQDKEIYPEREELYDWICSLISNNLK